MCFSGRATEELRKLRDTADERTVSIGLYVVLREEGEKSDWSAFQFVFCETCRRANADSLETSFGSSMRFRRSFTRKRPFFPRSPTLGSK
jgi:hypothetical protein